MKAYYIFLFALIILLGCNEAKVQNLKVDELTIASIHAAYQNGDFSCEDLVNAYLQKIDSLNPKIKAITFLNSNVIDEAKKLDQEFKNTGELKPLHGIPIIVKDNINTTGMPTTAGALALKDFIPEEDAFIIKKLKDAGAIILAKSNMAEWAFSPMHSESSTFGTTRNPYNLDYVPAGSSGGTGAAVAANLGTVGLGTDTGNSIRGPSSHNSLVGFRTTLGLISRSAIVPLYLRNDVVGPMCRTVEDATKVMEVMAGYDPEDPLTAYSKGKVESNYQQYLDKNGLQGARIGVFRELSENEVNPEIKALFEKAIEDMKSMGATIIDPVEVPEFSTLRQFQWCAMFRKDLEEYLSTYVRNDTISTLEDIDRIGTKSEFAAARIKSNMSKNDRWGMEEIPCSNAYTDERRIAFRNAIESVMDSLNIDAIVYPTWNNKPARIEHFQEEYKGDNNQVIAPHTGQPAFTVPMGFIEDNLPVGVQFLGKMYDEPTLIKLSYSYEQGTLHRKPPKI